MAGRLEGKIAVITGGGSGMGKAMAHRFTEEGASVVLADIPLGGSKAQLTFFAENLLDADYRVQGIDFGSLGFAGNVYGTPRRLGADLKLAF